MSSLKLVFSALIALSFASAACAKKADISAKQCRNTSARALQILGSGGPELDDGRNSSGYVIWIDGKAKILIDVGSGVAENFGRNGGQVADLDFIGLSHFHVDHTVGVPALVKNYFFEPRQKHIVVAGPPKGAFSPSASGFMSALFGQNNSAYSYLGGMVGAKRQDFEVLVVKNQANTSLLKNASYEITSSPVDHGAFPAIAYRIDFGDKAVVFSGDTGANSNALIDLSKGAEILVAHHAVPQTATGIAAKLHMKPSRIGFVTNNAAVKTLVLSHRMKRTIGDAVEKASLKEIRKNYSGPITWATDGQCIPF